MSDTQIVAIALSSVPTMIVVLIGILINNSRLNDMNTRLNDMNTRINERLNDMNTRISELRAHMDTRFDATDQRFDDMKETWRSELHRVEEVLDARLKHLEER